MSDLPLESILLLIYSLTFHDKYPSQTYCNFSLSQNCTVENEPSVMAGEVYIDIQAFLASLAGRDLALALCS